MTVMPLSIDAYIAKIEQCRTGQEIFVLLAEEIIREGYEDLIVACCNGAGENVNILHPEQPGTGNEDLTLSRAGCDTRDLRWIDVYALPKAASAHSHALQLPFVRSASSELTIPFHRGGDVWDIVSMIEQAGRRSSVNCQTRIKLKAYASIQRHAALLNVDGGPLPADIQRAMRANQDNHPPLASAAQISEQEGRAIALVEVSWRRYSAGLLDLNRRVPMIVGEDLLDDYLGRGLIEEEADDLRFNYVFRPTRAGQSHLRVCPHADQWRHDVWTKYVQVHERPSD